MKLPDRAALAFGFRPVRFPLRRRSGAYGYAGAGAPVSGLRGRLVIFAPKAQAEKLVEVLRQGPYSGNAPSLVR